MASTTGNKYILYLTSPQTAFIDEVYFYRYEEPENYEREELRQGNIITCELLFQPRKRMLLREKTDWDDWDDSFHRGKESRAKYPGYKYWTVQEYKESPTSKSFSLIGIMI